MRCRNHDTWQEIAVESWDAEQDDEPLGTKVKFWVTDPAGRRWLFKFARLAQDGFVSGEDWAECLVHGLAQLVGIPTAHANIASFEDRRGVLSLSVASHPWRLEHGDELLAATHPDYRSDIIRRNPDHTVAAVDASLAGIGTPPDWSPGIDADGFDLWAGYLMLDAWVSGTDRHPQNWAAVSDGTRRWLAPSFDHGNALGFQLRDETRERIIADSEYLRRWVGRGVNNYFAGAPSVVTLAHQSLRLASACARAHWLHQLQKVDMSQVEATVSEVPSRLLSDPGRTFCLKLLTLNRERILHVDTGGS